MRRSALLLAASAFVVAGAPRLAAAQTRYALTPFLASNHTVPGPSALYGAAVASYPGLLGVRVSGAVATQTARRESDGAATQRLGSYTADADAVLSAAAVPGVSLLLGGFVPAAFVGVGVEGGRPGDSATVVSGPVASYGVNVTRAFLGNLGLESEARYRVPTQFGGKAPNVRPGRGWEYRVGVTIGVGRRGRARASRAGQVLGTILSLPRAPGSSTTKKGGGTVASSASAARVVNTAERYVGTPYVYGGTTPDGFDCSGFVQYVYRKQGVPLPRTSRQQSGAGERVAPQLRALRTGDLMLFDASTSRAGIDHVAIYAGGSRMIHSTSSGGGVRYDDLSTKRGAWFLDHMVAARRVAADGRSLVNSLDAEMLRAAKTLLDPPDQAPRP